MEERRHNTPARSLRSLAENAKDRLYAAGKLPIRHPHNHRRRRLPIQHNNQLRTNTGQEDPPRQAQDPIQARRQESQRPLQPYHRHTHRRLHGQTLHATLGNNPRGPWKTETRTRETLRMGREDTLLPRILRKSRSPRSEISAEASALSRSLSLGVPNSASFGSRSLTGCLDLLGVEKGGWSASHIMGPSFGCCIMSISFPSGSLNVA